MKDLYEIAENMARSLMVVFRMYLVLWENLVEKVNTIIDLNLVNLYFRLGQAALA